MPTIRQMYGGMYSLYKTTYANGQLFRQTATQKNNSTNYLNNITSGAKDLISTYNSTQNKFSSEFEEKISALKNSSRAIKNFDFAVGEDALTTTENISESGEKIISTKYSDKLTDALKSVENFLSDYNDAINFFNDNSSVSRRVSNLAKNFSDTTYFAKNYSEIGIVTAKDGTMKIDEDKLVESITNNPQKVSRIMKGLSDRADKKISTATSMQKNLFPTARHMLGKNISAANFYGSSGFLKSNSYLNIGSLLNYML